MAKPVRCRMCGEIVSATDAQSSTQYTFDNRNRFLDWKTVQVPELIRIYGES